MKTHEMNTHVKQLLDAWDIKYYQYDYIDEDSKFEQHMYSFLGYPFVIEIATKLRHRTHAERMADVPQYLFRWSPKTPNRTIKTLQKLLDKSGLIK
jgi:hypothetical protein